MRPESLKSLTQVKKKKIKARNFCLYEVVTTLYEVVTTVPQTGHSSFQELLIQQPSFCVTFYNHKHYWFNHHQSVSLSTTTSTIDSTTIILCHFLQPEALLIQQLSVCVIFYNHKHYWFNNYHSVSLSTATSIIWFNNYHSVSLSTTTSIIDSTTIILCHFLQPQALLIQQLSFCVTFYNHKHYWFNNYHSVSFSTTRSIIDSTTISLCHFLQPSAILIQPVLPAAISNFHGFSGQGVIRRRRRQSPHVAPPPPPLQGTLKMQILDVFSGNSGNHTISRISRFMSWLVDFRKKMFPLSLCSDLRISANLRTSGSTVQQPSVYVTFYIHWQNPRCRLRSFTLAILPLWLITNPGSIKVLSLGEKC